MGAKWTAAVESSASLGAGAAIAAVFPPASRTLSLRRLIVGGRGASSPGQLSANVTYTQSAGTAGNTESLQPIGVGQYLGNGNSFGSAHSQFSADPTFGGNPLYELSFNSEGPSEKLEWEYGDFVCQFGGGGANGIMLYTIDAAPSGFLYTVTFEVEAI